MRVSFGRRGKRCDILGHHECDKCQPVHDDTAHFVYQLIALLVTLTTFEYHSSVKQFEFKCLCSYRIRFAGLLRTSSRSWLFLLLTSVCIQGKILVFPWLIFSLGQHKRKICQTLRNYNLAWGLHRHSRFGDPYLVSTSHAYQKLRDLNSCHLQFVTRYNKGRLT